MFAAWTERDQLVQWYGPDGYTVPECEMDVRVGGGFRICMMEPDGTPHWVVGKYLEITPPEVLSFTWAWEMEDEVGPESIVRLEFVAEDGGTRLGVSHTGFDRAGSPASKAWTGTCHERYHPLRIPGIFLHLVGAHGR